MSRLEKAGAIVTILVSLGGLYDAYVSRKRTKTMDEKDEKIRELERRLARLEKKEV